MNENARFKLVFDKLHEALIEDADGLDGPTITLMPSPSVTREELDEIDALRRIVLEVTEPEMTSFTTT